MPINPQAYFNALRSYLNTEYEVTQIEAGQIVLQEPIYLPGELVPKNQKIRLLVPGEALAIHLDKKNRKGNSDRLFHFLNDNARPWSKRCDFVIFHFYRQRVSALCFEFKSASFPDNLVEQLRSGAAWCRSLHSVIKHYTNEAKRLYVTKYVLSCHPNPAPYLDPTCRYLQRDYSVRHYLYSDINGMALNALDNANVEMIY